MSESAEEFPCRLMADFFGVFANPVRMRMFCALQERPGTVTQLAEYAEVSVQNASQHLRLMRDQGAVTTQRQGRQVISAVSDDRFLQAARLMREALFDLLRQKMDSAGISR